MSNLVPTMADVAREAGVSVVTVDRVLNRRAMVRASTEKKVLDAALKLKFDIAKIKSLRNEIAAGPAPAQPKRIAFFLLQEHTHFYEELAALIGIEASSNAGVAEHKIFFFNNGTADDCARLLLQHGLQYDTVALVCVDHPLVNQAVADLSSAGVAVYAMLTDITASQRAGYIGIDNRKAGRTAAWTVSRLCHQAGKVGILIGDHRFLCQELCEISFRSYLREHAPAFEVLDPRLTLESNDTGYAVTKALLHDHPDLTALYISCGGRQGVMQALRESGRASELTVVCHELTENTRRGLVDGVIDVVLSMPREALVTRLIELMLGGPEVHAIGGVAASVHLPFELITLANM